jgi:hypothetical protein
MKFTKDNLHIRQWLKRDGYPQTVEGYQSWKNKRREVA